MDLEEEEEEEEEVEIWSEEIKCRTVVDFGEEVRINVNISNLNSCLNFLSSFSKTRYAGQLLVSQNNLCTQLKKKVRFVPCHSERAERLTYTKHYVVLEH